MDDVFSKPRDFIDETRDPQELKKPFPVAWSRYSDLVQYDEFPEDDVTLGLKTPPVAK